MGLRCGFVMILGLFACRGDADRTLPPSSVNPFDSVGVGMTYDEVEHLLGKPSVLTRGVGELTGEDSQHPSRRASVESLAEDLAEAEAILEGLQTSPYASTFRYSVKVREIGQMMYVRWGYDSLSIDSAFAVLPVPAHVTNYRTNIRYFINDSEVSENEYFTVSDTVYWVRRGSEYRAVSKWEYQSFKRTNLGDTYPPAAAVKRTSSERVASGHTPKFKTVYVTYYVMKQYSVLFDAPSGRVALAGMFPVDVSQVPVFSGR